jgi:hypothetical protein
LWFPEETACSKQKTAIDLLTTGLLPFQRCYLPMSTQVSSPTLEEAIRGFRVIRNETTELVFDKPGDYIVPEPAPAATPAAEAADSTQPGSAAVAAVDNAEPEVAWGSEGGAGGEDDSEIQMAVGREGDAKAVTVVKEAAEADIFGA